MRTCTDVALKLPRALVLLALLALLPAPGRAAPNPPAPERAVHLAMDSDFASFLEAVPEALRYDEFDRPRFEPVLAVPDLSPYAIRIETFVREGKLVFRAEGPEKDGIPEPKELVPELRQKIWLPTLTERVELTEASGLELVSAALVRLADGREVPVEAGFSLDRPAGGEWQVVLRIRDGAAKAGTVRLVFTVRGHDLSVVEKFLADFKADRVLLHGEFPPAVRERLASLVSVEAARPRTLRGRPAVVSTSYRAALVGAQVAGLDDLVHVVHRGDAAATAARVQAAGATRVTLLVEPEGGGGEALVQALPEVAFDLVPYPAAEEAAAKRHFLGNAVVANPDDYGFASDRSYPRSSLLAPVYALLRRTGIVFVTGGDLARYEAARFFRAVNYGLNGYQYGFQWEDVARTRKEIADSVARLDLGARPHLALLGGGHSIPCTFFIRSAFPAAEFPKVRFDEDAVVYADASVYANLNDDVAMEACVGRLAGNTDEIAATLMRGAFRGEIEDREKVEANRALLVFGPWGAERDKPGDLSFAEETARELTAAGFACRSFTGSAWGRDFLANIAGARVFFANDFGYHQAGFGWSSYAHKGYTGPDANYNTQIMPLSFDASYCVVSSNGCATCDDKNRDNLHYGGNSLPAGLVFFRNGALGYFGMPNAALAEITTPVTAIATGVTLGEAMRKHVNDRIAKPEQGGLFGGPDGWRAEIPGYDEMPKTHPLLYPLSKQDALVLFGDPLARFAPPPEGDYLALAKGAGDFLVASAVKTPEGLNVTGEADPAEEAYGQAGAGAAIFLARLYEVTGEKRYLDAAGGAADFIAAATERDGDRVPGLFVGDSGKGLLYLELFRITKEAKYLGMADALARHFAGGWKYAKNGQPYWTTDLYAGAAGHLLFLLELARAKPDPFYLSEARRAGDFILKWSRPEADGGLSFAMEPWGAGKDLRYTGVAHGAAGIAIGLLALHEATKDAKYLAGAEAAAKWVMDVAMPSGDGLTWYAKYTPEPSQVKYQWCHGPPGMLLFFLDLWAATGKPLYREFAEKAAVTAAKPGKYYREDMSLCHGPPGNADVFLDAWLALKNERYLEIAKDHAEWVRQHALQTKQGLDFWGADRSYMNGVAGVGHFFLRMAFPGRFRPALIAK